MWKELHKERGTDEAQEDTHGASPLRLSDLREEVRQERPSQEAHAHPLPRPATSGVRTLPLLLLLTDLASPSSGRSN